MFRSGLNLGQIQTKTVEIEGPPSCLDHYAIRPR